MDKIEKIRKEIERQMNFYDGKEREVLDDPKQFTYALFYQGHQKMCAKLLSFIDSLEDDPIDYTNFTQKEVHSKGYDEAYLNNCIARAKKSWEGVDVDKFMDEVRGREPEVDLEKEYEEFVGSDLVYSKLVNSIVGKSIARHFYELGKNSK